MKVRCIKIYNDTELKVRITNNSEDENYEREVSQERAKELVKAGVCEIIETANSDVDTETEEKEEIIETANLDVDTETAVKKPKVSNKKSK